MEAFHVEEHKRINCYQKCSLTDNKHIEDV